MIKPRQPHIQWARTLPHIQPMVSVDTFRDRPTRFCPCGTRLRRSKPSWEQLCDTCDDARHVERSHEEFSRVTTLAEAVGRTTPCKCGRPMARGAATCRACYDQKRAPAA